MYLPKSCEPIYQINWTQAGNMEVPNLRQLVRSTGDTWDTQLANEVEKMTKILSHTPEPPPRSICAFPFKIQFGQRTTILSMC
jgi:hypothetical protein